MVIKELPVNDLLPYEKNAKVHPPEQITKIAESIATFGFKQPLVVDKDKKVIVGHGRLEAAKKLGLKTVPVIIADDLTPEQVKAYRLADNKLNESDWDMELVIQELQGLDITLQEITGFDLADLSESIGQQITDKYTKKIVPPIYEITGENPSVKDLAQEDFVLKMEEKIKKADIKDVEIKDFLLKACQRHRVFNYKLIAEYYAHAPKEIQGIMEDLALVVIDFDKAIELGYVKLTEDVYNQYKNENEE